MGLLWFIRLMGLVGFNVANKVNRANKANGVTKAN